MRRAARGAARAASVRSPRASPAVPTAMTARRTWSYPHSIGFRMVIPLPPDKTEREIADHRWRGGDTAAGHESSATCLTRIIHPFSSDRRSSSRRGLLPSAISGRRYAGASPHLRTKCAAILLVADIGARASSASQIDWGLSMKTIAAWPTAGEGYRILFLHIGQFFRLVAGWAACLACCALVKMLPLPSAIAILFDIVTPIVAFIAAAGFAVSWFRAVLNDETAAGIVPMEFGQRETRYLGYQMGMLLVAGLPAGLLALLIGAQS